MHTLWDSIRKADIQVIGVPEGLANLKGLEGLFKETVKFPQPRKNINTQVRCIMSLVRSKKQADFKTFYNQVLKAVRFSRHQEENTQKMPQFA